MPVAVARLPKLSDRTSGVLLHPTSLPGGRRGRAAGRRGAGVRRLPGRRRPELVADAAGRPDRLRQLALQRAVGVRRQPGAGRRRPADRRRPARARPDRGKRHDESAARGVRGVPARRRRAIATSRRSRPRARAWLDDFALYRAIKRAHGETQWTLWPAPLRDRDPRALAGARNDARRTRSRSSASCSGVSRATGRRCATTRTRAASALIGDIPIFMAHDSADVWKKRDLYHLDRAGEAVADRRRAARLLQRDRPALGQPALPLGPHARGRDTLGGSRASAPPSQPSTPSAWITSSASPATGRSRGTSRPRSTARWRRGPGAHFFKAVRRALARISCRSSPRTSASSRPRSRRCATTSGCPASRSCSSRSAPIRTRPTSCPTTTRATPSSTPARTTTTRPRAGSTIRAAARAAPSRPRRNGGPRSRYLGHDPAPTAARHPLADDPDDPDVGRRTSRSSRRRTCWASDRSRA